MFKLFNSASYKVRPIESVANDFFNAIDTENLKKVKEIYDSRPSIVNQLHTTKSRIMGLEHTESETWLHVLAKNFRNRSRYLNPNVMSTIFCCNDEKKMIEITKFLIEKAGMDPQQKDWMGRLPFSYLIKDTDSDYLTMKELLSEKTPKLERCPS